MNLLKNAVQYLEKSISDGHLKPGDKLPPLTELGKSIGTSNFTMAKAVKVLCKKGILTVQPRRGVWVSSPSTSFPQQSTESIGPNSKKQKWERLRARISSDILDSKFDSYEPMPSLKELRFRYGVSFAVIKKAMVSLEKNGIVTQYKKTYKPNHLFRSGSRYSNRLLLLVQINTDRYDLDQSTLYTKGFNIHKNSRMFINELESICNKENLQFEVWGYVVSDKSIKYISPDFVEYDFIAGLDDFYGFCIIKSLEYASQMHRMFIDIAERKKPMVIVDDAGMGDCIVPQSIKNKAVALFTINETDTAGRRVGQILMEQGHKNIAFISTFHDYLWSVNRYKGLCKALCFANGTPEIRIFKKSKHNAYNLTLLSKKPIEKPYLVPSLAQMMGQYSDLTPFEIKSFSKQLNEDFTSEFSRIRMGRALFPIFEEVLADRSITAWVGVDDRIALWALEYLKNKGIKVPRQISVIGFEDTADAFLTGLTSYNYDVQSVTRKAIAFLSNPTMFTTKTVPMPETNGYVVVRNSTGPVKVETKNKT